MKLSYNLLGRLEQVSTILMAGFSMIAFAESNYLAGLAAGMGAVGFALESIRLGFRMALSELVQVIPTD